MSLIALVSPGNAPGTTTTAFALTMAWPGPALLSECSPTGGHVLAGYFHGGLSAADRGLWHLALATRHSVEAATDDLWNQTVPLDDAGNRRLLPGLRDPFRAVQISDEMWELVGQVFQRVPTDVIMDIGHVGTDLPFPLVGAADLLLMVMRPEFAQIAAAKPRLEGLRAALGPATPLGLCLVGEGEYQAREVERSLSDAAGGFAVMARLPADARSAAILSKGAKPFRGFSNGVLMREASLVARNLFRFTMGDAVAPRPFQEWGHGLATPSAVPPVLGVQSEAESPLVRSGPEMAAYVIDSLVQPEGQR